LGGKLNILNAKYFDFLHSKRFQLFSQIQGHAIKTDSLTVHNSIRGKCCDYSSWVPKKLAMPLMKWKNK